MRALNVNLKQEVSHNDAHSIIKWMEDQEVTKYLNEMPNISSELKNTLNRANLVSLTPLFNREGSFFIVCKNENHPIGFIKLIQKTEEAELVVVIGDRQHWGKGLGTNAILQGLNHAFFQRRIPRVVAKIHPHNVRSIKTFEKIGFKIEKESVQSHLYSLKFDEYLKRSIS